VLDAEQEEDASVMTISEDRMKALDELGFDWGRKTKSDKSKSFEECIADLKASHA